MYRGERKGGIYSGSEGQKKGHIGGGQKGPMNWIPKIPTRIDNSFNAVKSGSNV